MQPFHAELPTEPRLRVVFDDSVFSFGFSPITTMADLAGWVADVGRIHHRSPVAIDVTLAAKCPPGVASRQAAELLGRVHRLIS